MLCRLNFLLWVILVIECIMIVVDIGNLMNSVVKLKVLLIVLEVVVVSLCQCVDVVLLGVLFIVYRVVCVDLNSVVLIVLWMCWDIDCGSFFIVNFSGELIRLVILVVSVGDFSSVMVCCRLVQFCDVGRICVFSGGGVLWMRLFMLWIIVLQV